jgi:hypothetical protein
MALQSSGAISLANIQTEFGGSHPISLSEYYGKDTVPSSGAISIGNFYGTSDSTATGGIITTSGAYTIHTFNSSSSFVLLSTTSIEYLVVGAGGGSGTLGGGGGDVRTGTLSNLAAGTYSITIGNGGAGCTTYGGTGGTGGTSTFSSISSAGGTGGMNYYTSSAGANLGNNAFGGDSGNGYSGSPVAYWTYGGGGGASADSTTAAGGLGVYSSISGSSVGYGGGGGGASYSQDGDWEGSSLNVPFGGGAKAGTIAPTDGVAARANSGGGGAPVQWHIDGPMSITGNEAGASGIIILRYS